MPHCIPSRCASPCPSNCFLATRSPWGCYVNTAAPFYGEPRALQRNKADWIGNSGTKWVPVDNNSWENYNVHGVNTGKEF